MKVFKSIGKLMILGLLVSSCYPYPTPEVTDQDLDIAVSQYKDSVDFESFQTYILIDSVAIISDVEIEEDDPFYSNGHDEVIIDEIRTQMNALGYTEVFQEINADLGMVATVLRIEGTQASYPGWWWSYPGFAWWWSMWFNTSYPYQEDEDSPGWYNTFIGDRRGSIVINMVDLEAPNAEDAFIWFGLINGILEDQSQITPERISTAVEATFKQSRNFYERETEK